MSKLSLGCHVSRHRHGSSRLAPEETAIVAMKAAYDAGIRTFDTLNIDGLGLSETLIPKFMQRYSIPREKLVITAKVYSPPSEERYYPYNFKTNPDYVNRWGLSRKNIMASVGRSIERLGTFIDVLFVMRHDPDVPAEEVMKALHDLVQSGQVRYIGAAGSMLAYQFLQLQHTAERHGWTKFVAMETQYSLHYREAEREVVPCCLATGVGLRFACPLGNGSLAETWGKGRDGDTPKPKDLAELSPEKLTEKEIIDRVETVARDRGVSMFTVALAWTLAKGGTPVVGLLQFTQYNRLDDAVAAVGLELTGKELEYLEEPYTPVKLHTV